VDVLRELLSKCKYCKHHSDFTVKSSIRLNTNEVYEFVLVAEAIDTGFVYDIFVNLDNDSKLLYFERVDGLKCNFKVHIIFSRLTRTVNDANLLINCDEANQTLSKKVKALEERNKQLESKLEAIKNYYRYSYDNYIRNSTDW
jgi:hypothetical protein